MNQLRKAVLAFVVLVIQATPLSAAQLLRDINTSDAQFVVPLRPVDLANVTLLALDDGLRGSELWTTDGTPAGTRLVLDIHPGPNGSDIQAMVALGEIALFWADDGSNGIELWRSDGTTAGTFIVANIKPDDRSVDGPNNPPLVVLNGVAYFPGNDGVTGVELWRTDGTRNGTYRLVDINPGAASSDPRDLILVGSTLFMAANNGANGEELWSSNGVASGTRLVRDINPGATGSGPRQFTASAGVLFFAAGNAEAGSELWRASADGQSASLVQDIGAGSDGSAPRGLMALPNGVVFAANTLSTGSLYFAGAAGGATALAEMPCYTSEPLSLSAIPAGGSRLLFQIRTPCNPFREFSEVWTTDGRATGTGPLRPEATLNYPSELTAAAVLPGGDAIFVASGNAPGTMTPATPLNLWRSDGTTAGTRQVTDFAFSLVTLDVERFGDLVYFSAGHVWDPEGDELWVTDGSTAGTRQLIDIRPGPASSLPRRLQVARGRLMFTAEDGVSGIEPWVSDGTQAGTYSLGNIRVDAGVGSSMPQPYLAFGDGMLFTADDGVAGSELWFSDGTEAGTRLVRDIAPGEASSQAQWFIALNGFALFVASDGTSGRELWRTDGTEVGTYRVADIAPGPDDGSPIESSFGGAVLDGVAYFSAHDGVNGRGLWRSDGTPQGTYQVLDTRATPTDHGRVGMITRLGDQLLFAAQRGAESELWSSDGSAAGTGPVGTDLFVGDAMAAAIFQGRLYYQGVDASGDHELWRTDGSADGTERVIDLSANGSSRPQSIYASGSALMFTACPEESGCALYVMSGASPAQRVNDVRMSMPPVSDGERLYFMDGTTSPSRLAVSDGTPQGTRYLVQGSAPFSGAMFQPVVFGGSILFGVSDSVLGPSVWRSDPSGANVALVADIDPGTTTDSIPGLFLVNGSRLFFQAYHSASGAEPWMIESDRPNATDDSVRTAFNTPVRIAVLQNDSDLSAELNRGSVEITTPPSVGSASVDAATGEVVYTPETGRSGLATLRYRVRNTNGVVSNAALVLISVSAPQGPPPNSPPSPPPPPSAPPSGGGNSGGGGGGGGGAFGIGWMVLLLLAHRRRLGSSRR